MIGDAVKSEKTQVSPNFDPLKDPKFIIEHVERIKGNTTGQKRDIHPRTVSLASHLKEIVPQKLAHKQYVYGIWRFIVKNQLAVVDGIYRDGFLGLLHELGFRKRYRPAD